MGKRRRKDKAHDIGDSMPGTVGDSQGAVHDRRDGPSFDPEDEVIVPDGNNEQSNEEHKSNNSPNTNTCESPEESQTKRMKYAKKYGSSWPETRQRRFLSEHNVSAKEMNWKLTE